MKKYYTKLSPFTALLYLIADIILLRTIYLLEVKYEIIGPSFTNSFLQIRDKSSLFVWNIGFFYGILSLMAFQTFFYTLFYFKKELAVRHVAFWRPLAILLSISIFIVGLIKLESIVIMTLFLPALYLIPPNSDGIIFPTVKRGKSPKD